MLGSLMAALLLAQGAAAPADPSSDIVVSGQRMPAPEAVRRYVGEIAVIGDGQLARYAVPVCPATIGLPASDNEAVVQRIRQVAREAGARVGAPGCTPNLTFIVTQDGRQFVRELQRTRPEYLAGITPMERRALMESEGPVRSWTATLLQNENGADNARQTDRSTNNAGLGVTTIDARSSSIITLPTRLSISDSYVVIDTGALGSRTATQIADYVAMRGLARVRAPQLSSAQGATILSLFAPGAEAPPSLSRLDLSYLRGLYRTRPNQRAESQLQRISRQMQDEAQQGR